MLRRSHNLDQVSIYFSDMEDDHSTSSHTPSTKTAAKVSSLTSSTCSVKKEFEPIRPVPLPRRRGMRPSPRLPVVTVPLVPKLKLQLTFKEQLDNPNQNVCEVVLPSSLTIHCMQPPYNFNTDHDFDRQKAIQQLWRGKLPRTYVSPEDEGNGLNYANMCNLYYQQLDPTDIEYAPRREATDNEIYRCAFMLIQNDMS